MYDANTVVMECLMTKTTEFYANIRPFHISSQKKTFVNIIIDVYVHSNKAYIRIINSILESNYKGNCVLAIFMVVGGISIIMNHNSGS